MTWRILPDDGERDPRLNLAREEALARAGLDVPTLRVWRSNACVVIGRGQIAAAEADLDACRRLGIPVLRRFTGGGAVYHDPGNVNVSIFLARSDPPVRRYGEKIPGLYHAILDPIAEAVRSLGLAATTDDRAVWVGDRKVSGVAAWLGGSRLLVHATLLVDADLDRLAIALAGPGAPGDPRWERTRSRRVPVTSLAAEGVATHPDAVDGALVCAIVPGAGDRPVRDRGRRGLTDAERAATERLLDERYRRESWHAAGVDDRR